MLKLIKNAFYSFLDPPNNNLGRAGRGLYQDELLIDRKNIPSALFQNEGLYLGKTLDKKNSYFRHSGEHHILTIGSTGSGKGRGCVIPNLLTYPHSVIVLDVKGENHRLSNLARQKMGHQIIRLDPFDIEIEGSGASSLNPLELLDTTSSDISDQAGILAEAIVMNSFQDRDPHWAEKAKGIIKGLILFICTYAEPCDRHLGSLREILMAPESEFLSYLELMSQSDLCGGLLRRFASEYAKMGNMERPSVMSNAIKHTSFLESPSVIKSLTSSKNSFNLTDLIHKKVSVYLIIPPDKLAIYGPLMRVWLSVLLQTLISRGCVPPTSPRIVFFLDEVAQLGRMDQLVKAVSLLRGYGMVLNFFYQDLGQMKSIYPHDEWRTFMSNCGVKQFFGINDFETAKLVSDLLGKKTVQTFNRSHSDSHQGTGSFSNGSSDREREVMTATEILRLPRDEMFLFLSGILPIKARRLDYLTDKF